MTSSIIIPSKDVRFADHSPYIAIGQNAQQIIFFVGDQNKADIFTVDFFNGLLNVVSVRTWGILLPTIMASPTVALSLVAQAAAGMKLVKIFFAEFSFVDQRDGQGISHRQCCGGTGCRRQTKGAGFFFHGNINHDVAVFCQGRRKDAGKSDDRARRYARRN